MTLVLEPVEGIGEVRPGDDLAMLVAARVVLCDGDVVVVTSKVVSKAEGLATTAPKDEVLAAETDRVVARRGGTRIVRTRHGLTMAAAGIDASNTAPGTLLPLPRDPDASARAIRARLHELTGTTVGVVISDTAGRAWRTGQTDIAIGCAGLLALESFAGAVDPYGNELVVTAPAVADEVAGAAELASGKLGGRPVVVVRGLDRRLLTREDGPGAAALVRAEEADLFGLGAREAVVAASAGAPVRGFPEAEAGAIDEVVRLASSGHDLGSLGVAVDGAHLVVTGADGRDGLLAAGGLCERMRSLAVAHGVTLTVDVAP
jgi:coenzyme F420-0:L-glutamate ligase/coenzyme F420-1:gamma-L-glutamate ligase